MPNMIYTLTSRGLIPILTHPERNAILQKKPDKVRDWVEMGVLVQVTASAFIGKWGRSVQGNWLQRRWARLRDTWIERYERFRYGHTLMERD